MATWSTRWHQSKNRAKIRRISSIITGRCSVWLWCRCLSRMLV